jgi:hypothetical protein
MSGAPALSHVPVEVNFEVTIEGDSNLSIFGAPAPTVANVLVADMDLPVNALYDGRVPNAKKGLIEYWEPAGAPDEIRVKLASTTNAIPAGEASNPDARSLYPDLADAYKVTLKQLAKGLQRVLCDKFDAVGVTTAKAVPFSDAKYAGKEEYTTQRDFGRVAIACFAHYLFGHVDATAAITNEVAFVKSMLSLDGATADAAAVEEGAAGAALRYAAYKAAHVTDINSAELSAWDLTGSNTDANLAKRLVAAIISKGLVGGVPSGAVEPYSIVNDPALTEAQRKTKLAYIVAQVAGQDATRLMNEDNTERAAESHQPLRFYAGDVIYMNIKLLKPTVTVAAGQIGGVTSAALGNSYDDGTGSNVQSYTLKITLKEEEDL